MADPDIDQAYRLLIAGLEEAAAQFERNPSWSQILALSDVLGFLENTGNKEVWLPLERLLFSLYDADQRLQHGGALMPTEKTNRLASAAAAVTVLKGKGRSVADALHEVCEARGLDQDEVRAFRDNISRKRVSENARDMYEHYLDRLRDL